MSNDIEPIIFDRFLFGGVSKTVAEEIFAICGSDNWNILCITGIIWREKNRGLRLDTRTCILHEFFSINNSISIHIIISILAKIVTGYFNKIVHFDI